MVVSVIEDREGNVWFGTYGGGVSRFNGETFTNYNSENSLPGDNILSIEEDKNGKLWFATNKGLSCYDDGQFVNYTTKEGLSHNKCYFVQRDDDGNLWIGTNRGVNRFDGLSFKVYTSEDGLASDEMNTNAVCKDSRDHLWFGTADGVTRYNPELDEPNLVPPPVHITRFRVFEQDTALISGIKLKHDMNYLRFNFVGLCLTAPETVNYQYKLEDIDKNWKNSNLRTVQYTSLPPGKYTFLVKAQNNDGIWSEQPAVLGFIITPPFWKTWWFIVTSILLIVGMAYGWHEKRVRNIEMQRRKLETQVAERTKALRELNATKDKFFSIIAHDLKNSLQVQLSGSRLLSERIRNIDKKTIETIGEELKINTENLFALLENLLQWSRIQTGRIEHHPTKVELQSLVDESLRLLKANAREKGVRLNADVKKDIFVYADKYMLNSVMQNLISNAVKFTKRSGKVKIASKVTNGDVQIAVADTGIGMKEEDMKKLFRIDEHHTTPGTADEKGSGLGLILCKEFIEKNGGKIWLDSKYGQGTKVSFTLPAA